MVWHIESSPRALAMGRSPPLRQPGVSASEQAPWWSGSQAAAAQRDNVCQPLSGQLESPDNCIQTHCHNRDK